MQAPCQHSVMTTQQTKPVMANEARQPHAEGIQRRKNAAYQVAMAKANLRTTHIKEETLLAEAC